MLNRLLLYRHNQTVSGNCHRRAPYLVIETFQGQSNAKGSYTVLKTSTVSEGEFICVIGHSGCGKSTLLNMVAGFNTPTTGKVQLGSKPITQPGPDRMVVFQNYAPLPWRTAFENIYIAVNAVSQQVEGREDGDRAGASGTSGTGRRCRQKPPQLSGG